jgi:hypothetical protein
MRLDKMMTEILMKIDSQFENFVSDDGSSVVQLGKALYGCVEAAAHLWYLMLREMLEAYGFETKNSVQNRVSSTSGMPQRYRYH